MYSENNSVAVATETKVCKACGRKLTIDRFNKNSKGYLGVCKECMKKKQKEGFAKKKRARDFEKELAEARNARLASFSPRDLMEELARRGYKGKLEFTETKVIDITHF